MIEPLKVSYVFSDAKSDKNVYVKLKFLVNNTAFYHDMKGGIREKRAGIPRKGIYQKAACDVSTVFRTRPSKLRVYTLVYTVKLS